MQRSFFRTCIAFTLLILVFVVIWFSHVQEKKVKQPHVVTQEESVSDNATVVEESTTVKSTRKDKQNTADRVSLEIEDTADTTARKRSVIDVYRDLRLARDCEVFYQKHHNEKGLMTPKEILDDYMLRFQGEGAVAAVEQYRAFNAFVQDCLYLKQRVFKNSKIKNAYPEYESGYPVIIELEKELDATQALTEEEKRLLAVREMHEELQTTTLELMRASQGDYKLNEAQRSVIYDDIDRINQELYELYQTDGASEEIDKLGNTIREHYNALHQRKPVDQEMRAPFLNSFLKSTERIKTYLYGQFPYSFEIAVRALELSSRKQGLVDIEEFVFAEEKLAMIPEYLPPSKELKIMAGIKHQTLYLTLLQPAVNLYMCHLGDDCSQNSHYMRQYCFGHLRNVIVYAQACEMDLMQFYNEVLLTEHQRKDVFVLLDLIKESYAL